MSECLFLQDDWKFEMPDWWGRKYKVKKFLWYVRLSNLLQTGCACLPGRLMNFLFQYLFFVVQNPYMLCQGAHLFGQSRNANGKMQANDHEE